MADAVVESGATHALVLGTPVTLRAEDYAKALGARRVAVHSGFDEAEIDGMQHMIDAEFHGQSATATGRSLLLDFCKSHVAEPDKTAVVLACTELPLAFPEHANAPVFQSDGYVFVNTTAVHVAAALKWSLAEHLQ